MPDNHSIPPQAQAELASYWERSAENAEERSTDLVETLAQIARTGDEKSATAAREAIVRHVELGGAHAGEIDDLLTKQPSADEALGL